jgi:signal transduction histidine kinase
VKLQLEQIQAGEKMPPHEFRLLRRDGRTVPVEATGIMINYDGAPAHLFIMRDITDRRCLESERLCAAEALHLQEQLLIKQGRFAAMGEMIGNIAHQWRQPLNALALMVQELPVYYNRGHFSKEYLEGSVARALKLISHMSKTIDSFRNFFNVDNAKVSFQASEVLEKTVAMMEAAFAALNLKIEIVVQDEICLSGNANEYSQVILNILMNAKDAIVERQVAQPWVEVKLFREESRAVVTITDNAGGIDEEIMEKIFDPYFSTKVPNKGTGIGLFTAKSIIEKNLNGTLRVSNVGEGAQFRIEVPEWLRQS